MVTLGCKTNQFESAAMSEQLSKAGYRQVAFAKGAELVIVNTCTVTAATDAQSRNLIRRARRINPQARVVVTGCYAQIDPEALANLPGVVLVIGNQEKRDFLDRLNRIDSAVGQVMVSDIRQAEVAKTLPRDIKELMYRINNNNFKIDLEHRGLDKLITDLDKSSNRLSFSFLIGSLIIGSSLIMQTESGPQIFGIPALGLLGYTIAAGLGLWLAIGILRSGRL